MFELSIVIPARNEEFITHTVNDLLKNKRGKTQILVGLDGYEPELTFPDHPDLQIVRMPESIGQRALQNRLAEKSDAKWIMKLDAHCAVDEGFDEKMLAVAEEDMTLVPVMKNLHIFDWLCDFCQWRGYQGPKPDICPECHSDAGHIEKNIVWNPKTNPQSSAYRFNKNLQFKYFPELRDILPREGLQESMSLQGSCFMLTREKYFGLNISDETWGSWGQQGSEVALKTWLSGGRVLCNFDTWYGHLFRTQDGFSFPYSMNGNDQERARKISRDLFLNDKWDQAIHPLSWLLEKFQEPLLQCYRNHQRVLEGVTQEGNRTKIDRAARELSEQWSIEDFKDYKQQPSREIIYYTAHQKPIKLAKAVQNKLKQISAQKDIPIRSVTLKPMDKMGENICLPLEPGKLTYFMQIITALRTSTADIVYMTEDDVLYAPEHFDYIPEDDKFHYDTNWWKIRVADGFAASWEAAQVSGLVARREPLLAWYRDKLDNIMKKGFDRRYEPGGRHDEQRVMWKAAAPHIDIRVGGAMTASKWSLDDFRDKSSAVNFQTSSIENIPGWEPAQLKSVIQ